MDRMLFEEEGAKRLLEFEGLSHGEGPGGGRKENYFCTMS